jgi:hypothetical protein
MITKIVYVLDEVAKDSLVRPKTKKNQFKSKSIFTSFKNKMKNSEMIEKEINNE